MYSYTMKNETPMYMFTSHEYNCRILYDKWYNELDEEKQVMEQHTS